MDTQNEEFMQCLNSIANSLEIIAESYKPKTVLKEKKEKTEKVEKLRFGQKVSMTQAEYDGLVKDYGDTTVNDEIEKMDVYCMANGKKYANYSFAVRNWLNRNGAVKLDPRSEKDWATMINPGNFVLNNPEYLESYRRFNPSDAKSIETAINIKNQYS